MTWTARLTALVCGSAAGAATVYCLYSGSNEKATMFDAGTASIVEVVTPSRGDDSFTGASTRPAAATANSTPRNDSSLDDVLASIEHAATGDWAGALEQSLALDDFGAIRDAITAIAAAWAREDPSAALASSNLISMPDLQGLFISVVMTEWAFVDSRGALRHLESADDYTLELSMTALEALAWLAPDEVLKLTGRLDRRYAYRAVVIAAMRALTQRDLSVSIARLGLLPPGQELNLARTGVATGYAELDAFSALSWARSLDPASPDTVSAVLSAVAQRDLEFAFELAASAMAAGASAGLDSMAWMTRWSGAGVDSDTMTRIGNRIASLDPQAASALVSRFGEAWSVSDPEAAFEWTLVNGDVGAQILGNLALNYSSLDIEAALAATDRLPVDRQARWVESVLSSFGFSVASPQDRDRVLAVLGRFEGQPNHERLVASFARGIAMSAQTFNSPGSVNAFIESLPEGLLRREVEAAMANSPWRN